MEKLIRLSKLLSQKGICSRREADVFIEKGWILVDGKVCNQLGTKVDENALIELSKDLQRSLSSKVTILLNKPVGYVSCMPEDGYEPAITLITKENQVPTSKGKFHPSHLDKLAVAGRLDINSKGLLVFTQCGAIAKKLIGEGSEIEKEYFVRVDLPLTSAMIKQLEFGLSLDDKPLKRAKVKLYTDTTFHITLREGKKRQIRRMCELVGLSTLEIKRLRIGRIKLGHLPPGMWRYLDEGEVF